MNASILRLGAIVGLSTCALVVACSSSKTSDTPSTTATTTAAAVAGAADTHCMGKFIAVNQASCHAVVDAGDADGGAPAGPEFGDTNYNSEADDDDCKYHVSWQSTAVAENTDVTFVVIATTKQPAGALAGAPPYAEVFLDDKTPAPNSGAKTTETTPGTYSIGPVRFDKPGKWTVRFHFHDECTDTPDSPHGHAAFYVNVP